MYPSGCWTIRLQLVKTTWGLVIWWPRGTTVQNPLRPPSEDPPLGHRFLERACDYAAVWRRLQKWAVFRMRGAEGWDPATWGSGFEEMLKMGILISQWDWMVWMVGGIKVQLGHHWAKLRCDPGLVCVQGTQKRDWSTASLESPDCPDPGINISSFPESTVYSSSSFKQLIWHWTNIPEWRNGLTNWASECQGYYHGPNPIFLSAFAQGHFLQEALPEFTCPIP